LRGREEAGFAIEVILSVSYAAEAANKSGRRAATW